MSEQTPQNENKENVSSQNSQDNGQSTKAKDQKYYDRRMDEREYRRDYRGSEGVGVGVTFIFIGVVWMMSKLGYIDFSIIGAVVDLWPLLFIVIGVNMIFRKVPYIGLITWVGFLSSIVAYGIYFAPQDNWIDFGSHDIISGTTQDAATNQVAKSIVPSSGNYPLAGNENVKEGDLSLDLSAGNLIMGSTTSNLLDYVIPSDIVTIESDISSDQAQFYFKEKSGLKGLKNQQRNYDFYLNPKLLWNVEVNAGALDSNMNFSNVPVRSLDINGGAGDFDLELGSLQDKSDVNINMAAGDVRLTVPKNVGIRIEVNNFMSDQNFLDQGLIKGDGYYQTADYETNSKVIYIELNSAVTDVTLKRK